VTEKLRADLVALLVLCLLGITGLVTPVQALEGFSNPAVVTIWTMFILSAGIAATGVADFIGERMLSISGNRESRVILVILLISRALSAFMNNIGVAAMMLPVTMDIARRTGLSPARLRMPMAFASLLGGLTTLVGTSLNLVAAGTLKQAGLESFGLFTFTPIGVPALIVGALCVAFVGRHFLAPRRFEWVG
jgi:di/tricarboxylate transporter